MEQNKITGRECVTNRKRLPLFPNYLRHSETLTLKMNAADDIQQACVHFSLDLVGNATKPSHSQVLILQLPTLQCQKGDPGPVHK